ncbi:MAG: LacI family DNA-binding transcriptional regulator [Chloroflexi bacterium]|nr:MAG: LacI family DNA-binding transcriptional regulator [Chloroflexota bacterium]
MSLLPPCPVFRQTHEISVRGADLGHRRGTLSSGDRGGRRELTWRNVTGNVTGNVQRPRQVSIRDVARAAGVSHQTVSRVINGHPGVRVSTRNGVLASIRTRYGYVQILHGIEEAARQAGYTVGVRVLDTSDPAGVQDAVEQTCQPGTGSVVVIAYDLAGVLALRAVRAAVPLAGVVEASQGRTATNYPCVWLDDGGAANLATRFLLDLGHRTVHYMAIPSSTGTSDRMAGWRMALEETNAPLPEPVYAGWTPESGYHVGLRLAADREVTAILCGNDDLALGALCALREAGRRVPEDVSVVGFDDIPQSAFYSPSLTTVRLDFVGLGRSCFHLLDRDHEERNAPASRSGSIPALIVRDSSGPPPERHVAT